MRVELFFRVDVKIAERVEELVKHFGAPSRNAFLQGILAEYIDIMDKEKQANEAKVEV